MSWTGARWSLISAYHNVTTITTEELETDLNSNIYNTSNKNDSLEATGESLKMEPHWYTFCICAMTLIWIVGTVGNFTVMFLVAKDKQLRTPFNVFLVNLALVDFIIAAFGSPFPMFAATKQEWSFSDTTCVAYGFGMAVAGITSIETLTCLAIERCLSVTQPLQRNNSIQRSLKIVGIIWIYALGLSMPPLFGVSSYGLEGPKISCSVSWEKDDLETKSFIFVLFIFGLGIPLLTMIWCYAMILWTIKSTRTLRATEESGVTTMVAVMIVCFLFAWSPYATMALIRSFGSPSLRKYITPTASIFPALFAKSSTCYNPLIYVALNRQGSWNKLRGRSQEENQVQTKNAEVIEPTPSISVASPQPSLPFDIKTHSHIDKDGQKEEFPKVGQSVINTVDADFSNAPATKDALETYTATGNPFAETTI